MMKKQMLKLFLQGVKDNGEQRALDQISMYIWLKELKIKISSSVSYLFDAERDLLTCSDAVVSQDNAF